MKILFAVTVCLSALSGLLVTYQIQSVPQDQSAVTPKDPDPTNASSLTAKKVDSDPNDKADVLNFEKPYLVTYPITNDPKLAYEVLGRLLKGHDVRMQQDEISGAITVLARKGVHALVAIVLDEREGAGYMLPSVPANFGTNFGIGNLDPSVYRLISGYTAADEDKRKEIKAQLKNWLSDSYKLRMKYHEQKLSSMKKRVEELEKQLSKRRSDSQEIVELQLKLITKQAEMGEPLGVNLNEPPSGVQRPNADLVERALRYEVKTQLLQRLVNELTTKINKLRKHLAVLTSDLALSESALEGGQAAMMEHIWILKEQGKIRKNSLQIVNNSEKIAAGLRTIEGLELQCDQLIELEVGPRYSPQIQALNFAINDRKAKVAELESEGDRIRGPGPEAVIQRFVVRVKQQIGDSRLEIDRLLKERDRLLGSETLKEKKAGGNLLGDLLKGGDLLGGVLNIDEGSKANSGGINERSPQLKK